MVTTVLVWFTDNNDQTDLRDQDLTYSLMYFMLFFLAYIFRRYLNSDVLSILSNNMRLYAFLCRMFDGE